MEVKCCERDRGTKWEEVRSESIILWLKILQEAHNNIRIRYSRRPSMAEQLVEMTNQLKILTKQRFFGVNDAHLKVIGTRTECIDR